MSLKSESGFNLIEIMVTIAISTIGLLGISSLQIKANQAGQDSGNRSQAVWMLEDLANRINANRSALADYDTHGDYACGTPPTMCANYYPAGGNVTVCSSSQVALFDLWDIACSRGYSINGISVREKGSDFISNSRLNVSADTVNKTATLSLTWDVRTSGADSGGNKLYMVNDDIKNLTDTMTRQVQL